MNIWWKHDMKTWWTYGWFSYSCKIWSSNHPLIFPGAFALVKAISLRPLFRGQAQDWLGKWRSSHIGTLRFSHKCCSVLGMIYDIPKIWNLNYSWFRMFIGWFLLFTKFDYVRFAKHWGETCNCCIFVPPSTITTGDFLQEIWSQPKSRTLAPRVPGLNPSISWESKRNCEWYTDTPP